MPRETVEQRAARWAKEEAEMQSRKKAFRETMPKRLIELQALAKTIGYQTEVELTETGPSVKFCSYGQHDTDYILTYDSEEWEVESAQNSFLDIKAQQEAKAARHKLAQDTFNTLTKEQKDAIKEHIKYLA